MAISITPLYPAPYSQATYGQVAWLGGQQQQESTLLNIIAGLLNQGFGTLASLPPSSGGVQYTAFPTVSINSAVGTLADGFDYTNGVIRPLSVTSSGALNISGSISATSAATAYSATQSYTNASSNPLVADLEGNLKTADRLIYNSTPVTLSNGQSSQYQGDSNGYLKVNVAAGITSDIQYASGATVSTPTGTVAMLKYNSTAPTVVSGDVVEAQSDSSGKLFVNTPHLNGNGSPTADTVAIVNGANQLAINGSGQVGISNFPGTQPVSIATLPALSAGTNSIGSLSANQSVNVNQIGGTNVVTGGTSGLLAIAGSTASGSAVANNPVTVGARAQNAEATAVSNGQVVNAAADLVGKLIVMPYANKENFLSGNANSTGTSSTSLIAAQAAGIKIYVTAISLSNTGTSSTLVLIQNGSGGSTIWQAIVPAGGGSNIQLPTPIFTSAATALYFASGTATSTLYVSATGYAGT